MPKIGNSLITLGYGQVQEAIACSISLQLSYCMGTEISVSDTGRDNKRIAGTRYQDDK